MKIAGWLARSARQAPAAVALSERDSELTYAQLERRVHSTGGRLACLGVARGDRVAVTLEPSIDHIVLLHALVALGAVVAPLDPRLPAAERERRLGALDARLVVGHPDEVAAAREQADVDLLESHEADEAICVIHTSGTSGSARPVELTHGNLLASALGSAARTGLTPADRWLCCMALHHVGGLSIPLRCALFGASVELERFDPDRIATLVGARPVTLASLVPTMLARLLDAGAPLQRLRCILIGGGPASRPLVERALAGGVPVALTYGLTEAASQVATLPPGQVAEHPGSVGQALAHVEVRVAPGQRILVRGPSVAPGAVAADGWLHTGDLGRLDPDGHLHVLGRADDVIVSGGENVSPEEVEQVLLSHPDVRDAGVGGRPDPEWQTAVVAYVVPREGTRPRPEELRAFCRERLARHAVPKAFELVEELPRNAQGKLMRKRLGASAKAP